MKPAVSQNEPEPVPAPASAQQHSSYVSHEGAAFWLERSGTTKRLQVMAPPTHHVLGSLNGTTDRVDDYVLVQGELSPENAAALRAACPWLTPRPLGLATSAGFGDRLGVATPGHVRAMQRHGGGLAPIFAQQSIREMTRTHRTPQEVMDDATWGAFQAGWRGVVGADADHQKTVEDLDRCAEAGFTLFTVDPGEHVDDAAHHASASDLERRVAALPWAELETTQADFEGFISKAFELHVAKLYRHLVGKGIPFELEVSVDETETPTSHAEHAVVASELKRLGVVWVGLAPRFVGRFEKGVNYIGDLQELGSDLASHAALARTLGPYKLSLHSGSDKFSVYLLIAQATGGLVYLKTAGTSYLEALRVAAMRAPEFFREILTLGRERFLDDRASYHISAELKRVPEADARDDQELVTLLDQDDARQLLHVTFGSALDHHKGALLEVLNVYEAAHYETLTQHFGKHLAPFLGVA